MAGKPRVIKGWELLGKRRPGLYLRQDLRAPRKSRLRRQFLNSLRSNRRNFHPPYPVFTSCGPSCSNKSLKYNHGRRSLSRSLSLLHFRAFRDFRGWIKNSRDVANEPRNTRKTRKDFSRDNVFPFSCVPSRYFGFLVQYFHCFE